MIRTVIASLRSSTNSQTSLSSMSISQPPAYQKIVKKDPSLMRQDEWISNSSRALAQAMELIPSADSTPLIKVQWEIFMDVFKDSIGERTDLMALEDVSIQFCFITG